MKKKFYVAALSIRLICVGISILTFSSQSFAVQVNKVYRADPRNYTQVFENGLTAFGTNINFYDHITGASGGGPYSSQDDAFISTSATRGVAIHFALDRLQQLGPGNTYTIYTIRGTDNIYPATETIQHLQDIGMVHSSPNLSELLEEEDEYSAYSYVSSSQIISASIYANINGTIGYVRTYQNPSYIASSTQTHNGPYTGADTILCPPHPALLAGQSLQGLDNFTTADLEASPTPAYERSSLL